MNQEYYKDLYRNCVEDIKKEKGRESKCSLYRLCSAAVAVGLGIAGFNRNEIIYYLLGGSFGIFFLLLVRWHYQIQDSLEYKINLFRVANDYWKRTTDGWKKSELTGSWYSSEADARARDLDIFGQDSLYQYICAANTPFGQDCLAKWLTEAGLERDLIISRQQAVKELGEKRGFSTKFQALARTERDRKQRRSGSQPDPVLQNFIDHTKETRQRPVFLRIVIWIAPVLTLFFLISSLLGVKREFYMNCFLIAAGVQLFLAFLGNFWNSRLFQPVHKLNQRVSSYKKLVAAMEQEDFTSGYMKELQGRLCQGQSAGAALEELEGISKAVVSRYNLFGFVLYNGLFLYDFHCAQRFLRWNGRYGQQMGEWLKAVGEVEALISLAVIGQVKPVCTMPEIRDSEEPILSAKNLMHPLIEEQKAVGNNASLAHRTCIITGSNMSGKTTFLRSIGLNLVLAYAGGVAAAEEFVVSPMRIYTSMRVEDSVSEGVSTFYAELLRIKKMIDGSRESYPMIALIDEIYKGTNSRDRITGARETIKRLARPQVLTILTTHDFELCDLEQDPDMDAVNFHFSEHYSESEILFDYKIKEGRCRTTNAQQLLRMVGILPLQSVSEKP